MDERLGITGYSLPPRLRALYAAVVIALASFVLLGLLFPEPIRSYRSRTVIEQAADSGNSETIEAPLMSQRRVEALAREVVHRSSAGDEISSDVVNCQIGKLSPTRSRLTIETQDRFANRSLELCRLVAGDVVQQSEKTFTPGLANLRLQRSNLDQRLALVRQSKREAENDLASLEREHLAILSAALVQQAKSDAQLGSADDEVLRLQREWQNLMAERRDLARTRTDDHPQIKDLDARLAELQRRLDALSRGTAKKENPVAALQDDFRLRSRELSEAVATARQREDELLGESARLAVTPEPIELRTRIVESPQIVERQGGQPTLARLTVLGVLSAGLGGLSYWALRYLAGKKHFSSAEDMQTQLGLPVLSVMNAPEPAPAPHWDGVIRRSVMAAELILLILALSTTALVLSQSQLTRPASADPFGAVAESLDRTLSPTLRR